MIMTMGSDEFDPVSPSLRCRLGCIGLPWSGYRDGHRMPVEPCDVGVCKPGRGAHVRCRADGSSRDAGVHPISEEVVWNDSEERAHRAAYSSLKHEFEKVGDHWEPKDGKGPSDEKAAGGRGSDAETAGGVDVRGHSKKELYERARKLDISGRSRMSKRELAQAIACIQD